MKVAVVVLLALVAVSQAAFTANLVQNAQPKIAQGMLQLRLASTTGRNANEFLNQIITAVQTQVNDVLSQIQTVVAAGVQFAQNFAQNLSNTLSQLFAPLHRNAQESKVILTTIVGSAVSGATGAAVSWLLGLFGRSDRFISDIIDFVSNFSVTDVLNTLAGHATNLINSIDLGNLVQLAVNNLLPDSLKPFAQMIIAQFGRGFWGNLWGSITDGASSAWNAVSNGASNLWDSITNVAGNMWDSATATFAEVQAMASAFASQAWDTATGITSEAADQFLAFLRPYQEDLGDLYDNVANQLSQIVNGKN